MPELDLPALLTQEEHISYLGNARSDPRAKGRVLKQYAIPFERALLRVISLTFDDGTTRTVVAPSGVTYHQSPQR